MADRKDKDRWISPLVVGLPPSEDEARRLIHERNRLFQELRQAKARVSLARKRFREEMKPEVWESRIASAGTSSWYPFRPFQKELDAAEESLVAINRAYKDACLNVRVMVKAFRVQDRKEIKEKKKALLEWERDQKESALRVARARIQARERGELQ